MKKLFIPLISYFGRRIERKRFSRPPIYIGGCGRSGTTLLLSILSAHKDIFACPGELNLFEGASFTGTRLLTPKFYRLYRTFISRRIKPTANRYCEKSPSNIIHFASLEEKHQGNFKFIQIIRDGRDVILSRHPRKKEGFWVEPGRWINDLNAGLKLLDHPNVLTIKYEDLVINYDYTISSICKFLNIELSEDILQWHKYATVRQNNALFSSIAELHASSVGKWKKPENDARVRLLTNDVKGKELLAFFGYLSS